MSSSITICVSVMYMHYMDATDLNIAQLTVTLMNSFVITENVNLNATSVTSTVTVVMTVM